MHTRCLSFVRRAWTFFSRRRIEARLRDELRFHVGMEAHAQQRLGLSPEEASRQARLAVGRFDRAREEYRDALGFRALDDLGRDVRLGSRGLWRTPGFALAASVTLALGIGANTLLFNAVYALLWRPLPFPDAAQLAAVAQEADGTSGPAQCSGYDAAWIGDHVASIQDVGLAARRAPTGVLVGNVPLDLESAWVSSAYLRALAVRPVAGRFFGEEEDRGRSAEPVALLAETAWRRYFGGDPSLVGKTITTLQGAKRRQVRIIGILPDRDTLPHVAGAEIVTAIPWLHPDLRSDRGNAQFRTVLRVRSGVSVALASSQVTAALAAGNADLPQRQRRARAWLVPLREALLSGSRTPIWMLYAAAGLLLVLTTANVASLFLARALARQHESAVRTALGASLRHVIRAQFAEALLVCLVGLGAAFALNMVAQPLLPDVFPELDEVGAELLRPSGALVGFGVACTLVVAGALALLPALLRRQASVTSGLTSAGRGVSAPPRGRALLAPVQLALVGVLLALGSLVSRSFIQALKSDPGFDPSGVITFRVSLPAEEKARLAEAYEAARIVASLPGTRRVAFSFEAPLGGGFAAKHTSRAEADTADPMIPIRLGSSGYLETLGARILRGRTLTEEEVRSERSVAVLNESAARALFGSQDPVGRIVRSGFGNSVLTIVGLVHDMRTSGLDRAADPAIYYPYLPYFGSGVVFSVRTTEPLERFIPAVTRRLASWNAAVVVRSGRSLEAGLRQTIRPRLRAGSLVGAFALLGLLIGMVGLYGTLSADVSRQRRELGIRLALGASAGSILGRVLGRGLRLVAAGVVLGMAGSAGAAVLIRRHLFGIGPWDGVSFATAVALMVAAASIAILVPALRAARLDPAATLRQS